MEKIVQNELIHGNYLEKKIHIEDMTCTLHIDKGIVPYIKKSDSENLGNSHSQKDHILHSHMAYEFFMIRDEKVTILFDEEKTFEKGSIVIIKPNVKHRVVDPWLGRTYSFLFSVQKNRLESEVGLYSAFCDLFDGDYFVTTASKDTASMVISFNFASFKNNLNMMSYCFHGLIAQLTDTSVESHSDGQFITDSDSSRLHKLNILINSYFNQNISISEMAEELKISTRQLNRIIQKNYGCKFRRLIISKRMELASNLLLADKTLSIIDVAMRSGYNSANGFYAAFKDYFGCLPNEYRDKHSTNQD